MINIVAQTDTSDIVCQDLQNVCYCLYRSFHNVLDVTLYDKIQC